MSFVFFIKDKLPNLPYKVGKLISFFPYTCRPGISALYRKRKYEINLNCNDNLIKKFIFDRMKAISSYAFENIEFYRKLYTESEVNPSRFSCFNDIFDLPIISKSDLQDVPIEFRSSSKFNRRLVNTGGSSGNPFSFFIQPNSIAHEWAHMHFIWKKLGYKQSDLKIVFGGRADVNDIVEYDALRHQLTVDIYKDFKKIADTLYIRSECYNAKYLHGYPSAIFDFIIWLDEQRHPLLQVLCEQIRGIFLGSEYPSPSLRNKVERILHCNSISWYGHTERAVLAYEKDEKYLYVPFMTYGFVESIDNKGYFELLGTSYYNHASPLIRYNTNDIVIPSFTNGLLKNFKISGGRSGEFIFDKEYKKVYLTALIFGRHHQVFEYVKHIQLEQKTPGQIIFYFTTNMNYSEEFLLSKMDLSNIKLDYSVKIISIPFRTDTGKVPLLIRR